MHNSNEFEYTTQEMPTPLKTARGKTRLDCNGDPLTSIRVKQSPKDKHRMIERMEELSRAYYNNPLDFPQDKVKYGVDPRPMTTERVFIDLADQIVKWRQSHSNDILLSFVIRHNQLLEYIKKLHLSPDNAYVLEDALGIRQAKTRRNAKAQTIATNFSELFN